MIDPARLTAVPSANPVSTPLPDDIRPVARESRSRFDKDVAWSAFAMIVPIMAGLVALPLVYRNAGQEVFTLFLLSFGAINFAPSFDMGISRTAQRRIAHAANLHLDTKADIVNYSLRRAFQLSLLMAVLAAAGTAALFPHRGSLVAQGSLAAVTGVGVALAIYANCQRSVLEGLHAFSRSALNRAAVGVALVGAPVLISYFTRQATILVLSTLIIRIPFIWEQARAIRASLSRDEGGHPAQRPDLVAGFLGESGWFALLSVLAVAMSGFDRYILIGWGGLGGQPLAVFLATQDLALRAIAVPTALLPALAVRLAVGDDGSIARSLSRRLFLAIVPGIVLACLCGTILSQQVIHLLYPLLPETEAARTLRVLFIGIAASAVAQFPMARLSAAGRVRDATLMHLAQFLLYLAAVPPVIHAYGAPGGAALWSGRIVVDAVMLILWSGYRLNNRSGIMREGAILLGSILFIAIGWTA